MREGKTPIFWDIRRYFCEYCGICRSKKTLITSHVLLYHKDELDKEHRKCEKQKSLRYTCTECGAIFRKPAYLKQHMQSHSLERAFPCPIDGCPCSYRRKDHLNRHLLLHEGKLLECPFKQCDSTFTLKDNLKRHLQQFHGEESTRDHNVEQGKKLVCQEPGCGKAFEYRSKLQKHENSHVRLESVEAVCCEPGCMKYFSNRDCLKAHIRTYHKYAACHVCGSKQLRKNIKRHLHTHEERPHKRYLCNFEECTHSFSTRSNLKQHEKATHLGLKPFVCGITGCGQRFSFKHVRDNHEKSACHTYEPGDFVEFDEEFRSRPRGGCKRKLPPIDALLRKRVMLDESDSIFINASEYISRFIVSQ